MKLTVTVVLCLLGILSQQMETPLAQGVSVRLEQSVHMKNSSSVSIAVLQNAVLEQPLTDTPANVSTSPSPPALTTPRPLSTVVVGVRARQQSTQSVTNTILLILKPARARSRPLQPALTGPTSFHEMLSVWEPISLLAPKATVKLGVSA